MRPVGWGFAVPDSSLDGLHGAAPGQPHANALLKVSSLSGREPHRSGPGFETPRCRRGRWRVGESRTRRQFGSTVDCFDSAAGVGVPTANREITWTHGR
jgi:hypothetical protein